MRIECKKALLIRSPFEATGQLLTQITWKTQTSQAQNLKINPLRKRGTEKRCKSRSKRLSANTPGWNLVSGWENMNMLNLVGTSPSPTSDQADSLSPASDWLSVSSVARLPFFPFPLPLPPFLLGGALPFFGHLLAKWPRSPHVKQVLVSGDEALGELSADWLALLPFPFWSFCFPLPFLPFPSLPFPLSPFSPLKGAMGFEFNSVQARCCASYFRAASQRFLNVWMGTWSVKNWRHDSGKDRKRSKILSASLMAKSETSTVGSTTSFRRSYLNISASIIRTVSGMEAPFNVDWVALWRKTNISVRVLMPNSLESNRKAS